jgi:hypothetical protein
MEFIGKAAPEIHQPSTINHQQALRRLFDSTLADPARFLYFYPSNHRI